MRLIDKTTLKRAASFRRVSTEDQATDVATSLAKQAAANAAMAERNGWEIVAEYEEPGISGRKKLEDRDEVQRLLKDADAGHFDVVLFYNPSRLGRHDGEALSLGYDLRDSEVLVAFSERPNVADIYDKNDRLLFQIGQWAASVDWEETLRRLAGGRLGKAKKGYAVDGFCPDGYTTQRLDDGRKYVEDPAGADVVRFALEALIAERNAEAVARLLNERYPNVAPNRGGPAWSANHVRAMARQTAYTGGGIVRWISPDPQAGEPKQRVEIDAPALVSPETWDRANAIISERRGRWQTKLHQGDGQSQETYAYVFSDRIVHEEPDGRQVGMQGVVPHGKKGDRARWYQCYASTSKFKNRHPDREPCAGFGWARNKSRRKKVRADLVEARFIAEVVAYLQDEDTLADLVEESDRAALAADNIEETIAEAQARRDRLDGKAERANESYIEGLIGREKRDAKLAEVEAERADIDQKIGRLTRERDDSQVFAVTIAELQDAVIGWDTVGLAATAETVTDPETGVDEIEEPGWDTVLERMAQSATAVLTGQAMSLPGDVVHLAAELAVKLNVRAVVLDVGENDPAVRFDGVLAGRNQLQPKAPLPLYGVLSLENLISR